MFIIRYNTHDEMKLSKFRISVSIIITMIFVLSAGVTATSVQSHLFSSASDPNFWNGFTKLKTSEKTTTHGSTTIKTYATNYTDSSNSGYGIHVYSIISGKTEPYVDSKTYVTHNNEKPNQDWTYIWEQSYNSANGNFSTNIISSTCQGSLCPQMLPEKPSNIRVIGNGPNTEYQNGNNYFFVEWWGNSISLNESNTQDIINEIKLAADGAFIVAGILVIFAALSVGGTALPAALAGFVGVVLETTADWDNQLDIWGGHQGIYWVNFLGWQWAWYNPDTWT